VRDFVAIKGCNDPAFILDHLKEGPDSAHPWREFQNGGIISTNFVGSELLPEWIKRIQWTKIDGYQCGFFKEGK